MTGTRKKKTASGHLGISSSLGWSQVSLIADLTVWHTALSNDCEASVTDGKVSADIDANSVFSTTSPALAQFVYSCLRCVFMGQLSSACH